MGGSGWRDRLRGPFRSRGARFLDNCTAITEWINLLEEDVRALGDAELRSLTGTFRSRLAGGESLDDLRPEAFAAAREAGHRVLGERPRDEQVMAGVAVHLGGLAELRPGEGKTLTVTMPAYLNALTGAGVHVATGNDHLARRDAEWMGPVYRFLGLTVGLVTPDMPTAERRAAYAADVTYADKYELGYDFLRDNLAWSAEECVQRGLHCAIVDDADQVLLDEARSPMIISAPAERGEAIPERLRWFATLAERLHRDAHYTVDTRRKTVMVTDAGLGVIEDLLGSHDVHTSPLWDVLKNAIKAKELFHRDVDYVVRDGAVASLDELTGGVLPTRRFSGGVHEAIEAKEGLEIGERREVLATITTLSHFRQYERLAGLTPAIGPDADEYREIYFLDAVAIPAPRPVSRVDHPDRYFLTDAARLAALVGAVAACATNGRPVLVETTGIEESEHVARLLHERGVAHVLLRAGDPGHEAAVIAEAGRLGAVTVSTGMLGRGTGIELGGADGHASGERAAVVERGGLAVMSTGHHPYRRLNDVVRGRAGRRGDPGESRFFLSLEALRRSLGDAVVDGLAAAREGAVVQGPAIDAAAGRAIRHAEERARRSRALVRGIEDVLDGQRTLVYGERRTFLDGDDLSELVRRTITEVVRGYVAEAGPLSTREDLESLMGSFARLFPVGLDAGDLVGADGRLPRSAAIVRCVEADMLAAYARREEELGPEVMRRLERQVLLQVTDRKWREHLTGLEQLQDELAVRVLDQRNLLAEYRRESAVMFAGMGDAIKEEALGHLFNLEVIVADD